MPHRIPQSVALTVPLKAYLASDHLSDATGKTIAVQISKNGAAFGNLNAGATNATEIGNGWYDVPLDSTDTGTLGPLIVRGTCSAVDNVEIVYQVVNANSLGAAYLDAAVSSRSTYAGGAVASVTAAVTVGTNSDKTGYALTSGEHTNIATDAQSGLTAQGYTTTRAGYLDTLNGIVAAIWAYATRTLSAFGFTVATNSDANVTMLLGRIPGTVSAQTGDAYARLGAPAGSSVSADVAALKTDLDGGVKISVGTGAGQINASGGKVPATVAAADVSGSPAVTAATVSDKTGYSLAIAPPTAVQVRQEMDSNSTKLANLDAAVSSRSTYAGGAVASVTAPVALTSAYDAAKTAGNATAANQATILSDIAALSIPTAAQNAQALLAFDFSTVTGEAARSLLNAARTLRNKVVIAAGVITVYKEDGVTVAFTETVTTDSSALPITGVTP